MSKKKRQKAKRAAVADALKAAGLDDTKAAELISELAKRNYVVMIQPPYGVRKHPPVSRPPTMPRSWM